MADLPCYRCRQDARHPRGVIYVRREVQGRWRNVPICQRCWDDEQPGRTPVRLRTQTDSDPE